MRFINNVYSPEQIIQQILDRAQDIARPLADASAIFSSPASNTTSVEILEAHLPAKPMSPYRI